MLHGVLKYPEVVTNLTFNKVSVITLELKYGVLV